MKKLLVKLILIFALVTIIITIVFPIRESINIAFIQVLGPLTNEEEINFNSIGARSINIQFEKKEYKIRVPFGNFFIIGMSGLIILSAPRGYFVLEIMNQILCLLIILLASYLAVKYWVQFLILADFVSIYLNPLVSIALVVIYNSELAKNKR